MFSAGSWLLVMSRVILEAESPVSLQGVPGELRQVFSNLLSNAIDASPAGSQIRIRIKQIGNRVQVAIADRGSGIPEAARAQVFEPFFTTKKDVGTGLGLWISKEIVANHGGSYPFSQPWNARQERNRVRGVSAAR